MVWKRIQVKKNNSFTGDSGVDVFSIGRGHVIGDMQLRIRCNNGANHNAADGAAQQTVVESIPEIKLYAGSRVFKNYSAEIARAFATYKTGQNPYFHWTQLGGETQEMVIPISFSRFPGDHQCALPAPLMGSLEMSVEYDFTLDADAGFATGTNKYDLFVDVIPNMHEGSMQGLKIIEETKKQDYTTLASGDDKVDMTISPDKQLRMVLAHAYKTAEPEGDVITDVGLKVDQTEFYVDTWEGCQFQNAADCRLNFEQIVQTQANTAHDDIYTRIPSVVAMATPITAPTVSPYTAVTGDQVVLTSDAADDDNILSLKSRVIPATAIIDLDKNLMMTDLLNMGVKDLDFTFTNGTASGALKVYEQVLTTY